MKKYAPPTLREKQTEFAYCLGILLHWCLNHDIQVTLKEVYRPPETAALYAQQGRGSARSLHTLSLAVDIALFNEEGKYETDSAAYQRLGEEWESLSPLCRWGGRFKKPDGGHFSLIHQGRA